MDYEGHSSEPRRWEFHRTKWERVKAVKISLPELVVGLVCGVLLIVADVYYFFKK